LFQRYLDIATGARLLTKLLLSENAAGGENKEENYGDIKSNKRRVFNPERDIREQPTACFSTAYLISGHKTLFL
jgi:hypothetical protein